MRPVQYRFLLWCNAIIFAIYLGGLLFDILVLVPNWRAGTIEEIKLFNDFFHKTQPAEYYRVIMPVSTALSVLCVIVFFNRGNPILILLTLSLLIDIGIDAVTWHYFVPINEYLFLDDGGALNADRVREYVNSWITADYLRIGLIMIGFYASIAAVHFSYRSR